MPKKQTQTAAERKVWADKLWVTWHDVGFGVRQYTCFHPDWMGPIGVVWVIGVGGDADMAHVLGSYTVPTYRRRGVRTAIQQTLKAHFRLIQTWSGSKDGGEAFLKASGYTFDRRRRDWFVLTGKVTKKPRRRPRRK
jgi:hypothetical protein